MADTIIRAKHNSNFTIIPNAILRDNHLSLQAMGLLCKLLSKPADWETKVTNLMASTEGTAKTSGRDSIRAMLNELKEHGYIEMQKQADGSCRYYVYDEPAHEKPETENPTLAEESQRRKNPQTEKPSVIQRKETTNKEQKCVLKPDDVTPDSWEEFVKMREKKKAPITQKVMDMIAAEARKAGWTMQQVFDEMLLRGWRAFKAEWVSRSGFTNKPEETPQDVGKIIELKNPRPWKKSQDVSQMQEVIAVSADRDLVLIRYTFNKSEPNKWVAASHEAVVNLRRIA